MVVARGLRIITCVTFIPAFALCLSHGVLSHKAVPAVGLVPLAFSAGSSVFLLLCQRKRHSGEYEAETQEQDGTAPPPVHPILLFSIDTILAVALMVVLVFTWTGTSGRGKAELAMLAAYVTMPILINFLIHLYLAVREFSTGLALHDLMQLVAWQAVPPDCPACGHYLRPESAPKIPWFKSISFPKMKMPNMKAPQWKTPAWLERRKGGEDAPLLVEDEESRYRDGPDEDAEQSTHVEEPEEELVVKKDKKGTSTRIPDQEAAASPWET